MPKKAQKTRVYLGERDISRQVLRATLERAPDEVESVTLVVAIESLHVDYDGTLIITIAEEA